MSLKSVSYQRRNKYVFGLSLNTDSDEADVTSLGRPFHTFAPATEKARPPTVDRRRHGFPRLFTVISEHICFLLLVFLFLHFLVVGSVR